jgi:hypothetical protein
MREREAFKLGKDMGKSRATWAFDGNTDQATYQAFLIGLDDGDPEIMDAYDPQFSIGEWAGESASELGVEGHEDAFLDGFNEGYWVELERIARAQVQS